MGPLLLLLCTAGTNSLFAPTRVLYVTMRQCNACPQHFNLPNVSQKSLRIDATVSMQLEVIPFSMVDQFARSEV